MNDDTNAETRGKLEIINGLDREFARLHFNSCAVIEQTSSDNLYAPPTPPEALKAIHFNDSLIYVLAGLEGPRPSP